MARWFRSYGLMVKWVFLSYRPWLSLFFAVEICIAIAFIYGMSYFYPVITPEVAKYLITGAPTLILLTTGFVMVPQTIASARTEGTFDYIWSLPVPRMAHIAADTTVVIGTTLPSIILAVILGAFRFDFSLSASLLVIPAIVLIAVSGAFIGYSIAFGVPKPMMVNVITQILVFIVMMFSPVMFPPERLPEWMQAIHRVLPIQYMADLVRGTLTDLPVNLGLSFAVVGAWCLGCFMLTYMMVRRRK
jgi:ABC-2 type transport system permease protein